MRSSTVLLTVLCALAALQTSCTHRHTKREEINEREYATYRNPGFATIEGQVTMTLPSGTTLDGAACQVRLSPITTETTAYITDVVKAGGTKQWKDDADSVWWIATADEQGQFRFTEVPSGSYYLTCPVAWRDDSGTAHQRILWGETTVSGEQTVSVTVSR